MIDNAGASGANIGYNEPESAVVEFTDFEFYGETEAQECYNVPSNEQFNDQEEEEEEGLYLSRTIKSQASNGECGYCYHKAGLLLPVITNEGKDIHPKTSNLMPFAKILSDATWNGETQVNGAKFYGFTSEKTHCGAMQHMFKQSPYAADYQHPVYLNKTEFGEGSKLEAVIKVMDPP